MMRNVWLVLVALAAATPVPAQEFHPPPVRRSGSRGTRIGLFGFGTRGGVSLSGSTQLVVGVTLDGGDLLVDRLRIRPSGEIGLLTGPTRTRAASRRCIASPATRSR